MLKLRRYRVFLAFAALSVLLLFHFHRSSEAWPDLATKLRGGSAPADADDGDPVPKVLRPPIPASDITEGKPPSLGPPGFKEKEKPLPKKPSPVENAKPAQKKPPPPLADYEQSGKEAPKKGASYNKAQHEDFKVVDDATHHYHGPGSAPSSTSTSAIPAAASVHWKKQEEHYPVSSTISLPSGSPKPVPRIQHIFGRETAEEKADRETKLASIKEAFTHSWTGYKKYAWKQDELRPVTNTSRNPFAGWGATLVDSLDTLWIMGLKAEFEEAVKAVGDIDFTTSSRRDIPLFETTIRYLGGLVAAYDVSGRKEEYRVLLDKAVELAEVLMGSFDTPNRMPVTFYDWQPKSASKPHRAATNVVLAEIGSLSLEFTRLAQLTKEPKYYDAIARITDALEEWQDNTRLPGLWPIHLDASGCKKLSTSTKDSPPVAALPAMKPAAELVKSSKPSNKQVAKVADFEQGSKGAEEETKSLGESNYLKDTKDRLDNGRHGKRQLDDPLSLAKAASSKDSLALPDAHADLKPQSSSVAASKPSTSSLCIPQGLASAGSSFEQYSIGGMADSVYEYLPKQHLLLGSLVPSYRTMYEKSIEVVKQKLLFRPMIPPGNNDVLFAGVYDLPPEKDAVNHGKSEPAADARTAELRPRAEHLTCFAGGMVALGAKIFNRPEELAIAEQLTEGCVWAYSATETGIMPETFLLIPCEGGIDDKCEWNATRWQDALDPLAENRENSYQRQMGYYSSQVAAAYAKASETAAALSAAALSASTTESKALPAAATSAFPDLELPGRFVDKRQLGRPKEYKKGDSIVHGLDNAAARSSSTPTSSLAATTPSKTSLSATPHTQAGAAAARDPIIASIYQPQKPLNHLDYVAKRLKEERIPKGFNSITSRNYLLRPEAIESVWYLYRITGSPHWRTVGWQMFLAIQAHCRAPHGYSAIDDVTKPAPAFRDEMESFWLAETLKYFWLLFEDEDVVSLDEWVLNTEAHMFRRPDA